MLAKSPLVSIYMRSILAVLFAVSLGFGGAHAPRTLGSRRRRPNAHQPRAMGYQSRTRRSIRSAPKKCRTRPG